MLSLIAFDELLAAAAVADDDVCDGGVANLVDLRCCCCSFGDEVVEGVELVTGAADDDDDVVCAVRVGVEGDDLEEVLGMGLEFVVGECVCLEDFLDVICCLLVVVDLP